MVVQSISQYGFISGIQQADEAEMKLMASTPHRSHIYNVANFDMIKNVQRELIRQVCAGVDDQLNALVSGEEGEMWLKKTTWTGFEVLHRFYKYLL